MVIGLLMGVWETWLWMKEYGHEETRGLLCLHQSEDIEAFRKTEVGEDNLGVLPWVLAELK